MRAVMALAAVGLVGSACATMDNLNSVERGDFLALNDVSYERVWQAANTVMARRYWIAESDAEIGVIKGNTGDRKSVLGPLFWRQSVALFVWPTESNNFGYTISFDTMPGPPISGIDFLSIPIDPDLEDNWRENLLNALKKELGAS